MRKITNKKTTRDSHRRGLSWTHDWKSAGDERSETLRSRNHDRGTTRDWKSKFKLTKRPKRANISRSPSCRRFSASSSGMAGSKAGKATGAGRAALDEDAADTGVVWTLRGPIQ